MRKMNLKIISDNGSLEFNKPYLSLKAAIIPFRWKSLMVSASLKIKPAAGKKILARFLDCVFGGSRNWKSWVLFELSLKQ